MKRLVGSLGSAVGMLLSLFAVLLVYPFVEGSRLGGLALNVLFTAVMFSSVWAVRDRRWWWMAGMALGVPWLAMSWGGELLWGEPSVSAISEGLMAAFTLYIILLQLVQIYTAPRVTGTVLCRAVACYLLLGIFWTVLYGLALRADPDALAASGSLQQGVGWAWSDLLYFSFTTMATLGPGDIVAVTAHARSLVIVQTMIGPLFLVILVARLVSLYQRQRGQRA